MRDYVLCGYPMARKYVIYGTIVSTILRIYTHDMRQVVKGDYDLITANPVFDGTIISLNLRDVFVSRCAVKLDMQVHKVAMYGLNWLSTSMMVTFKPLVAYTPISALKCLSRLLVFMLSSLPADPTLMCLDMVTRNEMSATFKIST